LILRAFARAIRSGEDVHLLFAGKDQTDGFLTAEIARLGLTDRVTVTGFLETKAQLLELIASVDAIVSLRSPHAGETSGSATAALSAGKPLIVQDVGSWAELPPDVAWRIGTDDEEETLAAAIARLASDPDVRTRLSERARAYARTELDVERCAGRLVGVARDVAERQNGHGPSTETAREGRIHWLLQGADRVKRAIYASGSITALAVASESFERYRTTLEAIPPARPGERLLDIGSLAEFLRLLESFWGYEVRGCSFVSQPQAIRMPADDMSPETTIHIDPVDVEVEPLPYPSGTFDVVTCLEVIEHLGRDPMHMLWEVNRVLRAGGLLILTTPNIVSARSVRAVLTGYHPQLWSEFLTNARNDRHNREYTPREIRVLFENAGFSSDGVQTRNTWGEDDPEILDLLRSVDLHGGVPVEDRGDTILAVARKAMLPAQRFPEEFYY
jgi:2-polyprenyl-3-methyl-5-hydroxy-6-metoxy-1,4-benzoquinol methylase